MPVQGVYKFTERNDTRRIIAGTIESGRIRVGDDIVFYPSGKKTRIETIEAFNRPPQIEASAGEATGFTVDEQVYVSRGEVATRASEPPPLVSTRMRVNLFWLGSRPLVTGKDYLIKLGTARVAARVAEIYRAMDGSDLSAADARTKVEKNQVADCSFVLSRPLAFDIASTHAHTSRFVIVDDYEISGGGIVREALPDAQAWIRDKVIQRNAHWDASRVSEDCRAERYGQRPTLVLITGPEAVDRKGVAREFEARLFDEGRHVYFLGMGNIVHGVDADIPRSDDKAGPEHVRRLAEVANILLDAGLIVIAAAAALSEQDAGVVRTAVGEERVNFVWLGDRCATDLAADLVLPLDAADEHTTRMKKLLQDRGVIFRTR
jgi:bifunctional enzyme CysN/CysC